MVDLGAICLTMIVIVFVLGIIQAIGQAISNAWRKSREASARRKALKHLELQYTVERLGEAMEDIELFRKLYGIETEEKAGKRER